jgi:pimeloyl-ACP methyl ester carboxylesterase
LKHNTENQMPGIEGVRNQTEDGFHFFDWGGSGPVAHIAHATGLAAGVYAPLAERLTSNFRVHAMDIRGHGRSSAPAEPARLKNWEIFYQDMERFFERFERPVVAIGHSMGGTVSMVAAARRPDLVSALVLIEPGVMSPAWRPWVYLVQKLGMAMRVPFVTRATKRKKAWPDVEEVRKDLYGKGTFRRWQDDFFLGVFGFRADRASGRGCGTGLRSPVGRPVSGHGAHGYLEVRPAGIRADAHHTRHEINDISAFGGAPLWETIARRFNETISRCGPFCANGRSG